MTHVLKKVSESTDFFLFINLGNLERMLKIIKVHFIKLKEVRRIY